MASVSLTALRRAYGDNLVVKGIEASIPSGEFISFLGPSGCGKTTTLRMVAGLDMPTAGEVRIGETVVSAPARGIAVPPEERRLGMVFQTYALWPHMSIGENVGYPLRLRGVGRAARDAAVERMLALVHLDGLGGRRPHELSGGQQQRVALARALVREPEVLLLDEPLSNLDAQLREELRFEIKDLQRRLGVTVIFVTHDQSEAMAMSDRILVMKDGLVRQAGPPMELYRRPADAFVAGFLGVANFVRGVVTASGDGAIAVRLTEIPGEPAVRCAGAFEPGSRVLLAIRPEALRPCAPALGNLTARVTRVTFLGDRIDCRAVTGSVEWRFSVEPSAAPSESSEIGLGVSEASAFLTGLEA